MKKEIEITVKLKESDFDKLNVWLKKEAKSCGQILMEDHYLGSSESDFYQISPLGYKDILKAYRVRITDKGSFICYKKRNIDSNDKTTSVDELETRVEDGKKALDIFKLTGLNFDFVIKKIRKVFLFQNTFEIVIDEVENLDTFVEIELKDSTQDVKKGMAKIYDLLKKIGIKKFIEFDRGYSCMLLNPDYNFGEKVEL